MISPITPIIPGFDIPTVTFAENQPDYIPLPAWRGEDGMVVTRWRFGWRERLRMEPMPSSRDDSFLTRCRYATKEEALAKLEAL